MRDWVARIQVGELGLSEIESLCAFLLDTHQEIAVRAEVLRALHRRGETMREVSLFVQVLLREAIIPKIERDEETAPLIDVCGTGGDGKNLFNVSTAVMFVVAGAGARVVKHGGRNVTSKSGGADVLEALGVSIHTPPEKVASTLEKAGCVFLFAPDYHPAFQKIIPVRKYLAEQGERTIFNILGPLLNPAQPSRQLAGVFSMGILPLYGQAMGYLGRTRAWAVHGGGGEDEISLDKPSKIAEWHEGKLHQFSIDPQAMGFSLSYADVLIKGGVQESAEVILGILSNQYQDARRDMVLLNAGAALVVAGIAKDLPEGMERARESITSGNALSVLRRLQY